MNDAERLRLIGDTKRLLASLEPISTGITAGRAARRRTARVQPTLRASTGGGGGAAGGGPSDPTLSAVTAPEDRAARVEAELVKDDADLVRAADLIHAVAVRTARALRPPKDPAPVQKERRCCASCARADLRVDIYVDRYSDHCRFCGDYRAAEGRVPPVEACRWKERHGKNPRADQVARWLLEERMPSRMSRS